MNFIPTFESQDTLWCACFPEDENVDIFSVLFEKWTDIEYLTTFFLDNLDDLKSPYWQGISIDKAIDLVIDEVHDLQEKLICIDSGDSKSISANTIFESLSANEFSLKGIQRKDFVKGKIDSLPQMLRIYGVMLGDGTIVISGGAIKLTHLMNRKHFDLEFARLDRVNDYLKSFRITDKDGLKE